ncbi:MAG: hypothetical protein ACLR4A_11645 [Christensenellales bacterium]
MNTGIVCAANIGTTDKIIGQLTGMSTLSEAAKNVIVRNPAGACKGLAAIRAFGKAFIQNEFDEVVHDEFFEGWAQTGRTMRWAKSIASWMPAKRSRLRTG